jgi:hypothetical protein
VTVPWLRWIANGFVLAYAADASLSGLDEALRATTGSTVFFAPRNALARVVLLAAFAMPVAVTLTPRLPAALLLSLSISALWLNFGAAPLLLLVGPAAIGPTAVVIQLVISALAFAWIRRRNGGEGWLLREPALRGPGFSLRRSLAWAAGLLLVGPSAAALYALLSAATWLQFATHGFVAFDASGVVLADRRYTRADREVRLVGMLHVGDEQGYRALVRSFGGADTAVLQEGVTDDEDLLETPLSYGRAPRCWGSTTEGLETCFEEEDAPDDPPEPVFLHADLDLASFAPETIAWLEQAAQAFAADDLLSALRDFGAWSSARANEWPIVERDLFTRRNEHLVARLDEALVHYPRVVVPWGAAHLPAIEAVILQRGFVQTEAARHRLFHWRGIAATVVERFVGGGAGN